MTNWNRIRCCSHQIKTPRFSTSSSHSSSFITIAAACHLKVHSLILLSAVTYKLQKSKHTAFGVGRNETKLGKLRMCSVHDVRRKMFSNASPMQISVLQSTVHAFIVKRRHVSTIWEAEHLNLLSHFSSTHPKATIRGSGSILCVRSLHNHGEACFAGIFRHRSFTLGFSNFLWAAPPDRQ